MQGVHSSNEVARLPKLLDSCVQQIWTVIVVMDSAGSLRESVHSISFEGG
jgi:hypothetical protein